MAPVPDDHEERPPPGDGSNLNSLSNINTATTPIESDFSDDDNDDNYPDTAGYMLLPQEPGNNEDDSDSESNSYSNGVTSDVIAAENLNTVPDNLPDEVLRSECGAAAPTVSGSSTSFHPQLLAKFPDGKIPTYLQDSPIPQNKDTVWNKKREETNAPSLDSAEENKILKAMSGFSLPTENIPEWARNMSDEQWHQHVVKQIKVDDAKSHSGRQQPIAITNSSQKQTSQDQNNWTAEFPVDP